MIDFVKHNKLQFFLAALLSIYMAVCFCFSMDEYSNKVVFLVIVFICFIITNYFFSNYYNITLKPTKEKFSKKEFILYGIFIIAIMFFMIFAFGAITSIDSLNQLKQVQTNSYSNWHPVVHTFIFFKVPLLVYNNLISCIIFQNIFILCILLYFCYFLRKHFLSKWQTFFVLLVILINPITLKLSLTLWKDIPFAWSVFLLTIFCIELVLSKGKWIEKKSNLIWFILACLMVMLFRHNGITCIFMLFIFLILIYKDKRKLYGFIFLGLILFRFLLYGPIYNGLNVEKTGGKAEMIGIVSSQIAYSYHQNVTLTDNEQQLLDELAPKEKWESHFLPFNFNYLKWDTDFNEWANKNFDDIMHLWIKLGITHPKYYAFSYLYMTSAIWDITDGNKPEVIDYDDMPNNKIANYFQKIYSDYSKVVVNSPLQYLFYNYGFACLIIMLSLFIVIMKSKNDFEKYIPFVPVITNSLTIMLLITGGEVRFIFSQIICALPLLIYALYLKEEKRKKIKNKDTLFNKLFVNETENSLLQFFRYGFVGGIAAVVNIGMLYVFTDLFHIYYIVSNILAFLLGLITNYILSKKFVFSSEVNISAIKEFIIYSIIGVFGLGFDTIFLWLFTDMVGIYYLASKLLSTASVFIWNFWARKVLYNIVK